MTFAELAKEIQEEHKKRLKDGDEEIITDGKEYILNKLEVVFGFRPQLDKDQTLHELSEIDEYYKDVKLEEDKSGKSDYVIVTDGKTIEVSEEMAHLFSATSIASMFGKSLLEINTKYTEEQNKEIVLNRDDMIRIVAMFWYSLYLKDMNIKDETRDDISDIINKYSTSYLGSNERARHKRIKTFYSDHKSKILNSVYNKLKNQTFVDRESVIEQFPEKWLEKHILEYDVKKLKEDTEKCIEQALKRIDKIKLEAIKCSRISGVTDMEEIYIESENFIELSYFEIKMIKYICNLIPDTETYMKNKNDTETENKLKDDHWEIFPEYQRNKLWKYISKLRSDYDRINRYMNAESKDHLNEKLKELELKLKYPYYYRIKNALELIEHFFDKNPYKKLESEKLSKCDRYLQKIKDIFN